MAQNSNAVGASPAQVVEAGPTEPTVRPSTIERKTRVWFREVDYTVNCEEPPWDSGTSRMKILRVAQLRVIRPVAAGVSAPPRGRDCGDADKVGDDGGLQDLVRNGAYAGCRLPVASIVPACCATADLESWGTRRALV